MKATIPAAALALLALAACNSRDETGRVEGADTIVTTRQEADTAIVTTDTTVDVDTVHREGDDDATREDTVKRQ